MLHVFLNDLVFNSTHGAYSEEAITGGVFKVDLAVGYEPKEVPVTHLQQTINYTTLYTLVKNRMASRTALLETLATEIALEVLEHFELAEQVNISIKKINAPILNFQGVAGVSYEIKRNR
jgi:dihydroneopterin aldolase